MENKQPVGGVLLEPLCFSSRLHIITNLVSNKCIVYMSANQCYTSKTDNGKTCIVLIEILTKRKMTYIFEMLDANTSLHCCET